MLANNLVLLHIISVASWSVPYLFPAAFFFKAGHRSHIDVEIGLAKVASCIIAVIHGYVYHGPVCRNMLNKRLWVHPADATQLEDLLLEDTTLFERVAGIINCEVAGVHRAKLRAIAQHFKLL